MSVNILVSRHKPENTFHWMVQSSTQHYFWNFQNHAGPYSWWWLHNPPFWGLQPRFPYLFIKGFFPIFYTSYNVYSGRHLINCIFYIFSASFLPSAISDVNLFHSASCFAGSPFCTLGTPSPSSWMFHRNLLQATHLRRMLSLPMSGLMLLSPMMAPHPEHLFMSMVYFNRPKPSPALPSQPIKPICLWAWSG